MTCKCNNKGDDVTKSDFFVEYLQLWHRYDARDPSRWCPNWVCWRRWTTDRFNQGAKENWAARLSGTLTGGKSGPILPLGAQCWKECRSHSKHLQSWILGTTQTHPQVQGIPPAEPVRPFCASTFRTFPLLPQLWSIPRPPFHRQSKTWRTCRMSAWLKSVPIRKNRDRSYTQTLEPLIWIMLPGFRT